MLASNIIFCKCLRKKQNEKTEFIITDIEAFSKQCFELYFTYTPKVEVIFCGQIKSYYVKLSPMCTYLNREMKDEFQYQVDRTNTKSKLNYLFKNIYYYEEALKYTQQIEEICKRNLILDIFFNHYLFWKDLSLLTTFAINFMIISSYFKSNIENNKYDYSFLYVNNEERIYLTRTVIYILSLLQFVFSSLILSNYIFKNLPKYTYLLSNDESISKWKKAFTFIYRMFMDVILMYHCAYLIVAAIGFFGNNYFSFAFHLLDLAWRSSTLTNLLLALWKPRKQLAVTLMLFLIVEYYFTIIIFLLLYEDIPDDKCLRFDECFFTVYDNTFKNSNGMINYLNSDSLGAKTFLGFRFWFDNIFCIVLVIFILQMIAGIIIDNFSALRENQQQVHQDKYNVCYICGLNKNELNKLYGNEEGYAEHTKVDHYSWNYMFLILNFLKKDKKSLSGLDYFIYTNYDNQNYSWIPYET